MQVLVSVLRNLTLPRACLVALLLGALNVLSFAPFFIWPIQLFSAATVISILISHPEWNKKQSALLGLSYGFGAFVLGVCWLVVAMSRYGGMPIVLSVIALSLLAAFMAIFPAFCFVVVQFVRTKWKANDTLSLLILFPVAWAGNEFLRGYLFTGFPWLSFGYAYTVSVHLQATHPYWVFMASVASPCWYRLASPCLSSISLRVCSLVSAF